MSQETDFSCMEEDIVVSLGGKVYAHQHTSYVKPGQVGISMCGFKGAGEKFLMVKLVSERFPDNSSGEGESYFCHVRDLVAWFSSFLGVELDIPWYSVCVQVYTPETSNCVPSLSSLHLTEAFCSCRAFVIISCHVSLLGGQNSGFQLTRFYFFFPLLHLVYWSVLFL